MADISLHNRNRHVANVGQCGDVVPAKLVQRCILNTGTLRHTLQPAQQVTVLVLAVLTNAEDQRRLDTGLSPCLMSCCQHLVHVVSNRHVALFLILHLEIQMRLILHLEHTTVRV